MCRFVCYHFLFAEIRPSRLFSTVHFLMKLQSIISNGGAKKNVHALNKSGMHKFVPLNSKSMLMLFARFSLVEPPNNYPKAYIKFNLQLTFFLERHTRTINFFFGNGYAKVEHFDRSSQLGVPPSNIP